MSSCLNFDDKFVTIGSFHDDAEKLVEKAYTTETFHYRVIVNLDNPFKTAINMTLVKNQIGACIPYEGISDIETALAKFHDEFLMYLDGGMTTTSAFYIMARKNRLENSDHPEIRYCIDPRLLKDAYLESNGFHYFLIPLEKVAMISSNRVYLALHRNLQLADVPPINYHKYPEIRKFFWEKCQIGGCQVPSFCLIVPPASQNEDILPLVYIQAETIPKIGCLPVLYGLKPTSYQECIYKCYYSYRKAEDDKSGLVDRAIDRLDLRCLKPDCDSALTWEDVATAVSFYIEGYEDGRADIVRSNKADELASDD